MDNLDWDVLEHPPNRDTITECESTAPPLPTSLTCEQNAIESEVQKQDCPDSERDEGDWDEMEASPFKETTTAIKWPAKLPPPTENNHEIEGGNRQNDYSDHEVDNLDWEVLEQPPDSDAKNQAGQHKPTTLKAHMRAETESRTQPRQLCRKQAEVPRVGN